MCVLLGWIIWYTCVLFLSKRKNLVLYILNRGEIEGCIIGYKRMLVQNILYIWPDMQNGTLLTHKIWPIFNLETSYLFNHYDDCNFQC